MKEFKVKIKVDASELYEAMEMVRELLVLLERTADFLQE